MTVAIAVRSNGRVCVAADSLSASGDIITQITSPKVEQRGNTIIAISGTCGHAEALRRELFNIIQKHGDEWPVKWPEYCLEGEDKTVARRLATEDNSYVLCVYKGRIFRAHPTGSLVEVAEPVLQLGCGGELALGAATALMEHYKSAETIAKRAVEIACHHNAFCGPPIVCESMAAGEAR